MSNPDDYEDETLNYGEDDDYEEEYDETEAELFSSYDPGSFVNNAFDF